MEEFASGEGSKLGGQVANLSQHELDELEGADWATSIAAGNEVRFSEVDLSRFDERNRVVLEEVIAASRSQLGLS